MKAIRDRIDRSLSRKKLQLYKPYSKQIQFHAAGATKRERLLRAGNQLGKTFAGAAESTMHATGIYPDWWRGRRFDKPTLGWVGAVTGELARDNNQRLLSGPVGDVGSGFIPQDNIIDITPARGVPGLADTITVRHISGGISRIRLKYYEQGREKWQAGTVDWLWLDEEPPEDIYTEALTRTNATGGLLWITFTPLLGMSNVVRRFLGEPSPDRHDTNMTIEDAEHISAEDRRKIIDSYPEHEREARTKGVPIMGSGVIFPISDDAIAVEPFDIPRHWPQLGGIDFGWEHPTAAVKIAYDRDADCAYVTACYRVKNATPIIHAGALRAWGSTLPWAWPHDGLQHDKGSGEQLAQQYRDQGLNLMPDRATFEDGTNGVEAGLMDMLDRMQTGRLKVFRNLADWFDEKHLYHRKDGKVFKEYDDIMSATRYALMMLRYAATAQSTKINYRTNGVI